MCFRNIYSFLGAIWRDLLQLTVVIYMMAKQRGVSRSGTDPWVEGTLQRWNLQDLPSCLWFIISYPSCDTILVQFLLLVDSGTKTVPSFVSSYLSDSFPVQFCKLDLDQLKAPSVVDFAKSAPSCPVMVIHFSHVGPYVFSASCPIICQYILCFC